MLYTYGFVPGEGQDWLTGGGRPLFFPGLTAEDPLLPQKKALLVALGADEAAADGTWVEVKALSRNGGDMAPFLRLVHLEEDGSDERAKALASWSAVPMEMWQALQKPINDAVEERVATTVLGACDEALDALPTADDLKDAATPVAIDGSEETAARIRERLAARVLLGERCALEACTTYWRGVAKE
jgi:hypothetical protein